MVDEIIKTIDEFFMENIKRWDLAYKEVELRITVSRRLQKLVEISTGKVIAEVDHDQDNLIDGVFVKKGYCVYFREFNKEGNTIRCKELLYEPYK